jgi:hypothetical protein
MTETKLRKLPIDKSMFVMAFEQDISYPQFEADQCCYLDRETGELIWLFEDDEDAELIVGLPAAENREIRERVDAAPERYLEIAGLEHGEHHRILLDFLYSDWTDDEALWRRTRDLYNGSIGRWKKALRDRDILHAFYDFQERRVTEMAAEFLQYHGIEPDWR